MIEFTNISKNKSEINSRMNKHEAVEEFEVLEQQ